MDAKTGCGPETKVLLRRSHDAIREGCRLIAALRRQRERARRQLDRLHEIEAGFRPPVRILYPSDTTDPRRADTAPEASALAPCAPP